MAIYQLVGDQRPMVKIPSDDEKRPEIHAWASDPNVSDDGKRMVFTSDRKRRSWYDICVQDEAGDTRCLVGNKSRYNRFPDFFPDGKRIIFLAGNQFNLHGRAVYSLWTVEFDGTVTELADSSLFTNPENWISERTAEPPDERD